MTSVGQELLNVPFPEMVTKLASAIAEGQLQLDLVSCQIAKIMGDPKKSKVEIPDLTKDGNDTIETSLIGAGFQPTFYQFTDTIIEVKMAITMTRNTEMSMNTATKVGLFSLFSASVNASYSTKYSYEASGSSLLRTRITPVPPSPFLTKMLEMKALKIQLEFERDIKQMELEIQKEQKKINDEAEE